MNEKAIGAALIAAAVAYFVVDGKPAKTEEPAKVPAKEPEKES